MSVLCLQKSNGITVYDETIKGGKPFDAVRADPLTGIVEYLSPTVKIVCQPAEPRGRK